MAESNNLGARWQRLLTRLDALAVRGDEDTLRRDVHHLVRVITQTPDPELSDEECLALLPTYVDAEIDDRDVARLYPAIKRHLDLSPHVEEEYIRLLEFSIAEDEGAFPLPRPATRPDLSFLRVPPALTLQTYSHTLAEKLLSKDAPDWLEDLEIVAERFFEKIVRLGRELQLHPQRAPALGFGEGELPLALQVLAVTYLATLALIGRFSPSELAGQTPDSLMPLAEQEAMKAARHLKLAPQMAQTVATSYASLVAHDAARLAVVAANRQP